MAKHCVVENKDNDEHDYILLGIIDEWGAPQSVEILGSYKLFEEAQGRMNELIKGDWEFIQIYRVTLNSDIVKRVGWQRK